MASSKKKSKALELNMQVLRRSRTPVKLGDIFVLSILPDAYHFGRVIRTDISMGGEDHMLVYIFRATSEEKDAPPALDKRNLLVPPIIVGRFMWTDGYFETVANRPLAKKDVLTGHCFLRRSPLDENRVSYCDEYRKPLKKRIEPCGDYGLFLELGVDNNLSDALGIPRCEAGRD